MNSAAEIARNDLLANMLIDVNGKGSIFREGRLVFPMSGFAPITALELHQGALAAREHAQRLLAATDNVDRLVEDALKEQK